MSSFDEYAARYEEEIRRGIGFAGVSHAVYLEAKANVLHRIAAAVGDPAGLHLLDVGCGTGLFARHLRGRFSSVDGVDPSAESIAVASRTVPGATFTAADGALPYERAHFDVTCAVCVFHHVPRTERGALTLEMARVTRPGGLVAIFEHNPWNPLTRLVVSRIAFDSGADLLSASDSRQLLRRAGVRDVRSRYLLFVPSASPPVARLERAIGRLPFGAQHYAYGYRP